MSPHHRVAVFGHVSVIGHASVFADPVGEIGIVDAFRLTLRLRLISGRRV